jgi:hypothetical protein
MQEIQYSVVQERLKFAKQIFEQGQQKHDLSLIQVIGNDELTHPYIQYDALVNYLLLTCFDKLGQPAKWLGFNAWLETNDNKAKGEREEAEKCISQDASPTVIAKEMHTAYQKIYGVKSSFNRFINEVLNKELQERLLSSVQIEKKTKDGQKIIIDEHKKKKSFLYESRNLFTHHLELTGTPRKGMFPDMVFVKGNEIQWIYEDVRNDGAYFYSVRRWPFELFEIISSVIGEPIEIYDFDLECRLIVQLESDKCVDLGSVKFSSLRDLSEINNEALRRLT